MNTIIKAIAVALYLGFACNAAAESYRSVKILKTDGSHVYVCGEKDLAARFVDGEAIFAVGEKVTLSLSAAEMKKWELSPESSVATISADTGLSIEYSRGSLTVAGMADGTRIRISDLSGICRAEATAGSRHTFDISHLPAGVYILSCNAKSIKLHIRQ